MPKKIGTFVEELAKNGTWSDKFEADPEGAMAEYGLDTDQIALVMTGDIKDLRKQIHEDNKPRKSDVFRVKRG
jgi:hypothetical protein